MLFQTQFISQKPAIMPDHMSKIHLFHELLMQRALRIQVRDKNHKAYRISFRESRNRKLAEVVEASTSKNKLKKDLFGSYMQKTMFGESYLNLNDGIYLDFLHCFSKNPSKKVASWFYDVGLADLFDLDKKEKEQADQIGSFY